MSRSLHELSCHLETSSLTNQLAIRPSCKNAVQWDSSAADGVPCKANWWIVVQDLLKLLRLDWFIFYYFRDYLCLDFFHILSLG